MEEVVLPVDKVDIIVSEWMGYFLFVPSTVSLMTAVLIPVRFVQSIRVYAGHGALRSRPLSGEL